MLPLFSPFEKHTDVDFIAGALLWPKVLCMCLKEVCSFYVSVSSLTMCLYLLPKGGKLGAAQLLNELPIWALSV